MDRGVGKTIVSTPVKEIQIGDVGAQAAAHADGERMSLNVGPSHPTTHGVLRLLMELDGDLITRCEPVLGYLHRGDEKIAENMTYNQFVPYTDRLDYLAPLANNVAYAITVEKLAGIKLPERCEAIRVLVCEMARISSHLLGMGVFGMDAGAWTPFMYTFTEREKLYTLFEELTGARFTTSYTRIGGVARDLPEGWLPKVEKFVDELPKAIDEVEKLLTRNRIFLDRTEGIGTISKDDAIAYGLTGPNLRASGVDLDLRKDKPYSGYEKYEFDVPIGSFQLIQKKLAEMITEITKAQLLTFRLGELRNEGKATTAQISMAKRNNVEIALNIAREARQIHGGMGITSEYSMMRHMANLESVLTYEGTHDIHLLITGMDVTGIPSFTRDLPK